MYSNIYDVTITGAFIDKDYALIFLPESVDNIEPVSLNNDPYLPIEDGDLKVFGWGGTVATEDDAFQVYPTVPEIATLQYIPSDQFASAEYWNSLITPDQLCAYYDGKAGCSGDSGKQWKRFVWSFIR